MLACDFFTVETVWLKTLYVLFFLELGTRRVRMAGCTAHPTSARVTQQARQISWTIQEEELPIHFLIHDRDAMFPLAFDHVFEADDVTIIRTPFRAPKANAFAERWIRSVREECLDHVIILSEQHLFRVLKEYEKYFNHARPHQGIGQQIPAGDKSVGGDGPVCCRDVLGGIIHDYYRQAA
ncbi:MAG: transposase [Pyrinomonadaceae bacterium]|nr:transposase [Pyrinomonadaceae bacterium]